MLKVGRNLEMKYSIVGSEDSAPRVPEHHPRPFFGGGEERHYKMNLDPELAADLSRLRNAPY